MNESASITGSTVVTMAADVLARRADDETVLLQLETELYFGLNGVGSRVWELVQGEPTFDAIVAALAAEYDAPIQVLEADLTELLSSMVERGLVVLDAA